MPVCGSYAFELNRGADENASKRCVVQPTPSSVQLVWQPRQLQQGFVQRTMEFFALAVPRSESELSAMESMLAAHGIPYFVHNRGFGGLFPGMQIPLYNVQRVMVPFACSEEAVDLFRAFSDCYQRTFAAERLALWDRARVVVESICGGWAMPFKYRKFIRGSGESEVS